MKEIMSLLTPYGFDNKIQDCKSLFNDDEQAAYNAVEAIVYHYFKHRRYKSYESYLAYKERHGTVS